MYIQRAIASFLKWQYLAEGVRGHRFGEDCVDFPDRTICFIDEAGLSIVPKSITIHPNDVIKTDACQSQAQWHLPRISKRQIDKFNYAYDSSDGEGVDVYVLDTWLDDSHRDFKGNVQRLPGFVGHDPSRYPEHGTHCAGLVGSQTYGTARGSSIFGIQVLDDAGYGSYYEIVQALGVIQQRIKTRKRPTVVSISISGGRNDAINRALEDLLQANILLPVVAAGNANQDATNWSPASANVLTVGAMDIQDKRSSFSNYGPPVKIFAPGSNIVSTCPRQALCAMSGTSMATPIVAGIAATLWSHQPKLKPKDVLNKLVYSTSLKNVLRDIPRNTANRLIHLDPVSQCLLAEQAMILQ